MVGYVGYDPSLATIIVGHQGTDREKMYGYIDDFSLVGSHGSLTIFVWLQHSGHYRRRLYSG